jgi:ribonucleotide reductase class II
LNTEDKKGKFLNLYNEDTAKAAVYLRQLEDKITDEELEHRISRFGLNPCGKQFASR